MFFSKRTCMSSPQNAAEFAPSASWDAVNNNHSCRNSSSIVMIDDFAFRTPPTSPERPRTKQMMEEVESQSALPLRNLLSKRLSKRSPHVPHSTSPDMTEEKEGEDESIALNPNFALLMRVLENKKQRNELINKLLCLPTDFVVKLRFCIAVNEHASVADKQERMAKGRKIVSLFIQNGSMFCLVGVPQAVQQTLILPGKENQHAKYFEELKTLFVRELAGYKEVVLAIESL